MKRKAAISPTRTKDTGQRGLFPWMQSLFETLTLTPVLTSVDLAAQCLAQAGGYLKRGMFGMRRGPVSRPSVGLSGVLFPELSRWGVLSHPAFAGGCGHSAALFTGGAWAGTLGPAFGLRFQRGCTPPSQAGQGYEKPCERQWIRCWVRLFPKHQAFLLWLRQRMLPSPSFGWTSSARVRCSLRGPSGATSRRNRCTRRWGRRTRTRPDVPHAQADLRPFLTTDFATQSKEFTSMLDMILMKYGPVAPSPALRHPKKALEHPEEKDAK